MTIRDAFNRGYHHKKSDSRFAHFHRVAVEVRCNAQHAFRALRHCSRQDRYLDAFSTGNFVQRFMGRL